MGTGAAEGHGGRYSFGGGLRFLGWFVRERVKILPEYEGVLSEAGLGDFGGVWGFSGGSVVTREEGRSVFEVELPGAGGDLRVYLKRYGRSHWGDVFESILHFEWPESKSMRECRFGGRLSWAGVATAEPAAVGEARIGFFPLESFLVVKAIRGAHPLDIFLDVHLDSRSSVTMGERLILIGKVAEVVARMHWAGLFHRQLYARHVFVRREGGTFGISMLDLGRMRRGRSEELVVGDLAALNVTLSWWAASRADRMRFLRKYVRERWGEEDALRVRRLAELVVARSRQMGQQSEFSGVEWRRTERE